MAKELFKSSSNTNFILNMTEDQYSSLASKGLIAAFCGVPLFTLVPEITGNTGFYTLAASGLAISGVLCMILALIGIMKKYISKSALLPVSVFGFIVLWGIISTITSKYSYIGLYGYDGRNEGLFSLVFYFCFFVTALCIKRKKAVETVAKGIIGVGLLNSLWSLYQIFISTHGHYKNVSLHTTISAASGLSHSPIFLAFLLTLSLITALITYAVCDSKKFRIFLLVCCCLYSFVMMFTYCIVGITGAVLGIAAVISAVIRAKAPKIRLLSSLAVILPSVLAVILASSGIVGNAESYKLYDGQIAYWCDSYIRISAGGHPDTDSVDLYNTYETYTKFNDKTLNIISLHPLTGTGPDQLALSQLYSSKAFDGNESPELTDIVSANKGIFDRVYNEYLYTAATRGIPSALALAVLLISVIAVSLKKSKSDKNSPFWSIAVICGAVIFIICCGSTAVSPIFWAIAGCSAAEIKE